MEEHDGGHEQGGDVGKASGDLEDDGIREADVARIAVGGDADAELRAGGAADETAEGQRGLLADGVEVAEAHDGGGDGDAGL